MYWQKKLDGTYRVLCTRVELQTMLNNTIRKFAYDTIYFPKAK